MTSKNEQQNKEQETITMSAIDVAKMSNSLRWVNIGIYLAVVVLGMICILIYDISKNVGDLKTGQEVAKTEREQFRRDQVEFKIAADRHRERDNKRFEQLEDYLQLKPIYQNKLRGN